MKTVAVKGHKGVRLKENGKFIATRSIKGTRYTREFTLKRDAVVWKANFHPLVDPNPKPLPIFSQSITSVETPNGRDQKITFGDVLGLYKADEFSGLDDTTRHKKELRGAHFWPGIMSVPMCRMNPIVVTNHLKHMKLLIDKKSKRCNFEKELKDLNRIFVWYSENQDYGDFSFQNPIKKFHKKFGVVKDIEPINKNMSIDQLQSFFDAFEDSDDGFMFQSLAVIEFYMAGRPQEGAAINDRTVDFNTKKISVTEKIVWLKGKPIHRIGTKTKHDSRVDMNEDMYDRLLILKSRKPKGCKFFFNHKGKMLRHGLILSRFNAAMIKAGLSGEFSGINFLRHSMATLSRKLGGLNASQAMLRHTTARMSEHYAKLDVNENVSKVVIEAAEMFKERRLLSRATICNQVDEVCM